MVNMEKKIAKTRNEIVKRYKQNANLDLEKIPNVVVYAPQLANFEEVYNKFVERCTSIFEGLSLSKFSVQETQRTEFNAEDVLNMITQLFINVEDLLQFIIDNGLKQNAIEDFEIYVEALIEGVDDFIVNCLKKETVENKFNNMTSSLFAK